MANGNKQYNPQTGLFEDKIEPVKDMLQSYGTRYKPTSNCGTCLNNCFQGIKQIKEKYG